MRNPFNLHQTDTQTVRVLHTHRDILPETHPDMDVHPNNDLSSLNHIKQKFQLPHQPFLMKQTHGDKNIELKTAPPHHFWQAADACFTRHPNIICTVMTADCLPVMITDEQASFVAAVHCGWRSLYQGILTKLLDRAQSQNGLIVWFGPAICANHYQVDNAFRAHYLKSHPDAHNAFTDVIDNHCYADLKVMAQVQLKKYDVKGVQDSQICTFEHNSYDSWRHNKTRSRQAAMIWIKPQYPASNSQP